MTHNSCDCDHLPKIVNIKKVIPLEKECTEYWSNVLSGRTFSIKNKTKMNNMYIFRKCKISTAKGKTKVKEIKLDFFLMSKLLMACQTRNIDLKNLFSQQNINYPPSNSKNRYLISRKAEMTYLKRQELGKPLVRYFQKQFTWILLMVQGSCTVSNKSKPQ